MIPEPDSWSGKARFYFRVLANSYSEIFFFEDHRLGLALLLTTFINPNIGISGFLCVLSAYLFARFLGLKEIFRGSGYYTFNPLLVGLSIGFLFKITPLAIFFLISAGITTFIVTMTMANLLYTYMRLPVINLPFVLVSMVIYLAAYKYSNLLVSGLYATPYLFDGLKLNLPTWFTGLTRALGCLLFSPHVIPGLIFLTVLFLASRILFFLAVSGYFLGVLITASLEGSFYQAFSTLSAFNFSLIAMAIGGVFLIPSPKSYIMAAIAVAISPLLLESANFFWAQFGIPAFTLPFNVITLSLLYALGLAGYPYLTFFYRGTPERILDHYLSYFSRFPGTERTLDLPFSGEWTVWQAFNGPWTHQGIWKYAIDFLIMDEGGQTFTNEGAILEDYHCYQKPVLSPARGRVAGVVNDIPDNAPGEINEEMNWGNHVMIYDHRGFYVLLAHFRQGSIKVSEGQWVEPGQMLGLCGNSGYSPQPHIHIQVQLSPELGAPTLPFSFIHYAVTGGESPRFMSNHIPKEGMRIQALYPDKGLDNRFSFLLDDETDLDILVNGEKVSHKTCRVRMDPDGTYYFDAGADRIFFNKWHGTFYVLRHEGASEWARAFFMAMPRVPLTFVKNMTWEDYLPLETYFGRFKRALLAFSASFNHDIARVRGIYRFVSTDEITGEISGGFEEETVKTLLRLDPQKGFSSMDVQRAGRTISIRRTS